MNISRLFVLVSLLFAMSVNADELDMSNANSALDLSVPQQSTEDPVDPPGTWYGDTSEMSADADDAAPSEPRCPTSPEGEPRPFTGSVTTGMGYSRRAGSSIFGGATINYCKELVGEEGDSSVINVSISVGQYGGPFGYGGYQPYSEPLRRSPGKPHR